MASHFWNKLPKESPFDILAGHKCIRCRIIITCTDHETPEDRIQFLARVPHLNLFEDCDEQAASSVHNS